MKFSSNPLPSPGTDASAPVSAAGRQPRVAAVVAELVVVVDGGKTASVVVAAGAQPAGGSHLQEKLKD